MLLRANKLWLTTDDIAVMAAVDAAEVALLRYSKDLALFLDGPAPESTCAYALALAAALNLMTLTAQGAQRARPFLIRAIAHADGATRHEQQFVAAIAAWAAGDMKGAIARHMAIAHDWPHDLLSLKILHFHQINTGDFTGMLASLDPVLHVLPGTGFVHGMYAFALEQCGETHAAEYAGRHAASLGPDPWAHHAVAHVLDTERRNREGRAWMYANCAAWNNCSSFMYTHNWWHAALFEISLGDHDAALELYDTRIWGVRRDCCQDQINAVSLLLRLEMLGVDPADRWHDLAPHLEKRIYDRANPLADLHYAYGLARAGADHSLAILTYGLHEQARSGTRAHCVTAIAADGMVAHARGQNTQAAIALRAVMHHAHYFGGSHTQRRLFDLVAGDAASRAAKPQSARRHDRELLCAT